VGDPSRGPADDRVNRAKRLAGRRCGGYGAERPGGRSGNWLYGRVCDRGVGTADPRRTSEDLGNTHVLRGRASRPPGRSPVRTLDDVQRIDIAIDGADEVDREEPDGRGGAAHTREKVIASFAELRRSRGRVEISVGRLERRPWFPWRSSPWLLAPVLEGTADVGVPMGSVRDAQGWACGSRMKGT
jgi:hypothetical protein